VAQWASDVHLGTRALGLLQAVGGVGEAALGGTLVAGGAATSEVGVGIPIAAGGYGLALLGADQTSTGFRRMWTGEYQPSMVETVARAAGASPQQAALIDATLNIAAPIKGAAVIQEMRAIAPYAAGAGIVGNSTTLLEVNSAESMNEAMIAAGNKPAWLRGTSVSTEIVPQGTQYQMVVSEGQAKALLRGEPAFGGFATTETVTSQAFARDKLVILDEFKSDVSYVATVETTSNQTLNRGLTGPLGNYTGQVEQVEFLGQRNLQLVGQPKLLPKW